MRESRTSGSGRGDQGNPVPYRQRILPVSGHPGEGHLTEQIADVQPAPRELVFMPHLRPFGCLQRRAGVRPIPAITFRAPSPIMD